MKRVGISSAVLAVLCASSLPALAEEGHTSLPQLDPSFYPGELFWLFVSFPLFFLMMQLWAVPKFQRTQENRQKVLDTDLSAARKASDQAKAMMADGDKALASARAEVRKNVDQIVAAANSKAAEQKAAQDQKIAARLAEANAQIDTARKAVMKDVPKMIDELVAAITLKVLAPATKTK